MKSDTATTALNFALVVLLVLGVVFAVLTVLRVSELRRFSTNVTLANVELMRARGLVNDTAAYNNTAKSPELAQILKSVQPKNAAK